MELYYHRTDGGAEYYSTKHIEGSSEGAIDGVILRTDGDEIEIFADNIRAQGLKIVITGGDDLQEPARDLLHEEGEEATTAYYDSEEGNPLLLFDPLDPNAETDADGYLI